MATSASGTRVEKLGIWRCTATGTAVLGVLFLICWLAAAFTDIRGSHMFIGIFTRFPVQSSAALVEGLCWSFVFGAATGALTAIFYNLFGSRPRRDLLKGRPMKSHLNGLALIALIIAVPGLAAEPDPHTGHHPAPSAAAPAMPPKAEAEPAPSPGIPGGMMPQPEGMGMMKGMGGDSAMPMQGMMDGPMPMGGPMPMEGHQHMMDHMATMHGMSPSMMMMNGSPDTRPMWEHVDACIAFLKTELKITPAQTRTWEAFANRLRENAEKMRDLRSSTQMGKVAEAPLMQRLDHQEKWFATGYENIRALKPLVTKLYDSLSVDQRKTADVIIPPHLDLMQAM